MLNFFKSEKILLTFFLSSFIMNPLNPVNPELSKKTISFFGYKSRKLHQVLIEHIHYPYLLRNVQSHKLVFFKIF